MTTSFHLTESDKILAAKKLSSWLDLDKDAASLHKLRTFLEDYFSGCESLYISLHLNDVSEHVELDNDKIPQFVIDIVGIELFEGKHGKKIREMLLEKIYEKDHWSLRKLDRIKPEASEWNQEEAKKILKELLNSNWIPGGGFAKRFVTVFGFPLKFAGVASPAKPEKTEMVEKRVHLKPLEPFQENLMNQILETLAEKNSLENRCILQLPTGAGKTRTAAQAIIEYWKNRSDLVKWVVWIAHTEELCEQAFQCFRQLWEEIGEEGTVLSLHRVWGGKPLPDPTDDGIVIAGIDQLSYMIPKDENDPREDEIKRIKENVGAVFVDEAHHSIAPIYRKVLNSFGISRNPEDSTQTPLIGLTATPFRTSDIETEALLKKYCKKILRPSQKFNPKDEFDDNWRDWDFVVDKLTSEKILSIPRFHYLDTESVFEMDAQETEFLLEKKLLSPKLLNRVGRDTKRNLEVYKTLKIWADKGRTILFFGSNLNQAVMMSKFLNDNKIKSAVITADTKYGTRQNYVRMFKEKKIQVLCNYQVLTTGFDAPLVDTIIIARPTGSRNLYEQMIGRGLRGTKFGGTDECEIITVLDNILNYEKKRVKLGYEEYADSLKVGIGEEEKEKFRKIRETYPDALTRSVSEPKIPEPGEVFTEDQLYERFKVQTAGGIRFTKSHNAVVLIDSDFGNYHDTVDEKSGTVIYTGTGEDDQGFDSGMGKFNARIRDSENYTLLYFHKPEKNKIVFKYQVKYDSFYYATEKNVAGNERRVIKFKLKIIKAICPSCNKMASTDKEVEDWFGYRNMNGTVRNQSWCKECRNF